MDILIIYPQINDKIVIVNPALNCGLTIQEIAQKDVPEGVPYVFINSSELPPHLDLFDAWEADFSKPDGYGIGHKAWFAARGINI
jgi:hypothetical protein